MYPECVTQQLPFNLGYNPGSLGFTKFSSPRANPWMFLDATSQDKKCLSFRSENQDSATCSWIENTQNAWIIQDKCSAGFHIAKLANILDFVKKIQANPG